MSTRHLLTTSIALTLMCAPAFAQGMQPAPSDKQAPAVNAPPAKSHSTTGAATPAASKVNLNSATEAQLEKLAKLTRSQAKAIVAARSKAKFKDWNDFAARKVIPADAAAGIKDSVAF
jgi:DNA uptake protein ComE-like DNA-binding protein